MPAARFLPLSMGLFLRACGQLKTGLSMAWMEACTWREQPCSGYAMGWALSRARRRRWSWQTRCKIVLESSLCPRWPGLPRPTGIAMLEVRLWVLLAQLLALTLFARRWKVSLSERAMCWNGWQRLLVDLSAASKWMVGHPPMTF